MSCFILPGLEPSSPDDGRLKIQSYSYPGRMQRNQRLTAAGHVAVSKRRGAYSWEFWMGATGVVHPRPVTNFQAGTKRDVQGARRTERNPATSIRQRSGVRPLVRHRRLGLCLSQGGISPSGFFSGTYSGFTGLGSRPGTGRSAVPTYLIHVLSAMPSNNWFALIH